MHHAAEKGNCAAVTALINVGSDINKCENWSYTPMHMALRRNCKLVCQVGYNSDFKKLQKNSSKDKKSFVNAYF